MTTGPKKTTAKKNRSVGSVKAVKTTTSKPKVAAVTYEAGSFLDRRGGMVPTVRLGKWASINSSNAE